MNDCSPEPGEFKTGRSLSVTSVAGDTPDEIELAALDQAREFFGQRLLPVSQPEGPVESLARLIHSEMCVDAPECGRWDRESSRHRAYYQEQARRIFARLEPEIGSANVFLAVSVILDEVT